MNNLDFLNLNTVRNYPIRDSLSRISRDGFFTIPNDLIADIAISAPATSMLKLFISKIVSSSESVYIEISVAEQGILGIFNVPFATHIDYQDYPLTASALYPNAVGTLTIGYINDIKSQPCGEFTFEVGTTELLMRVFTPAALGINYLRFTDTKGNEASLTGYVNIHAENNLRFRTEPGAGEETVVCLDAGDGLGLNKNCSDSLSPPIKTINGIPPDDQGDFNLIPSDCINIEPIEAGVLIKDTCGKPCLGCNELGVLTDRLISVENELLKLKDYVTNLEALMTQLTTLVNYQCDCE